MSSINVYGAGIQGVLTSLELSKKFPKKKINLVERSDVVLPSWKSIRIDNVLVNPGAHAIEIPRANKTIDVLRKYIPSSAIREFQFNAPMIIGSTIFDSREPIRELIPELRSKFNAVKSKTDIAKQKLSVFAEVNKDKSGFLYSNFAAASKKFGTTLESAWGNIYPWFFPADFLFEGNDEASVFYNSVRRGQSCSYVMPSDDLLDLWINHLEKSLASSGVNVFLNSNVVTSEIGKNTHDIDVWCGPAIAFLEKREDFLQAIEMDREFYLSLFEIEGECVNKVKDLFCYPHKEILVASTFCAELNKISLVTRSNKLFLLAEYITGSSPNHQTISKNIIHLVKKTFNVQLKFRKWHFLRKTFRLNQQKLKALDKEVEESVSKSSLIMPVRSWGPQNTSRVASAIIFAESSVNKTLIQRHH